MDDIITREQVQAFRAEAQANKSAEWIAICDSALAGSVEAWNQCAEAICALEWPWA